MIGYNADEQTDLTVSYCICEHWYWWTQKLMSWHLFRLISRCRSAFPSLISIIFWFRCWKKFQQKQVIQYYTVFSYFPFPWFTLQSFPPQRGSEAERLSAFFECLVVQTTNCIILKFSHNVFHKTGIIGKTIQLFGVGSHSSQQLKDKWDSPKLQVLYCKI